MYVYVYVNDVSKSGNFENEYNSEHTFHELLYHICKSLPYSSRRLSVHTHTGTHGYGFAFCGVYAKFGIALSTDWNLANLHNRIVSFNKYSINAN